MCGIVAIYNTYESVAPELFESLIHLQHRGQDAAGILTMHPDSSAFHSKHGLGLVKDVFHSDDLPSLPGNLGIAHVRYPTSGGHQLSDAQPMSLEFPITLALAHNGNLVDYQEIFTELQLTHKIALKSTTDSKILLFLLAHYLKDIESKNSADFFHDLTIVIQKLFKKLKGSYSLVVLIAGKGLLVFRDPHGLRPLVIGTRQNKYQKADYIFASETTMFYGLGFSVQGNVRPGEVIFIDMAGEVFRKVLTKREFRPCVFEYVYFARPDSNLDEVNVYRARLRMGENLAHQWEKNYPDIIPDVVIPAPFTSNTAALAFATTLKIRYSEGLYKNPFIGRTFIMPTDRERRASVRYKLTPQKIEIENKNVLILDDSIVRGTTSREIVKMVRESGAKKIYFASTAPPLRHPCFYGIDIPSSKALIASEKSLEDIRTYLEVDILLYQDIEDLVEAVTRKGNHQITRPCMACMDGQYIHKKEETAMKFLIIGSGAREHAIAKALKCSNQNPKIFCYGNTQNLGIQRLSEECVIGDLTNIDQIVSQAKKWHIDMTIIGPELPLSCGLADALWLQHIPVVGPRKNLAQIETSKSFTRNLLQKYSISGTLKFKHFDHLNGVQEFLEELGIDGYVIKADGLMAGKGVKVAMEHLKSFEEAYDFCASLVQSKQSFLIEEKIRGLEFSLMCFCDGHTLVPMPVVQDYKRAFVNDTGPNTGGMGSYSDANHRLPFLSETDLKIALNINQQVLNALNQEFSEKYIGILYGSFMLTQKGVYLIEYNARFGDPEAMNVLSLLQSDFVSLCQSLVLGKLANADVRFAQLATVCKYAVPEGYPENPKVDVCIDTSFVQNVDSLYYASVHFENNELKTTHSRSIAILGQANTISEAEQIAESEINRLKGGLFHRADIATKVAIGDFGINTGNCDGIPHSFN